jgi:hypothetical protein
MERPLGEAGSRRFRNFKDEGKRTKSSISDTRPPAVVEVVIAAQAKDLAVPGPERGFPFIALFSPI